jgi:hypothetical protein
MKICSAAVKLLLENRHGKDNRHTFATLLHLKTNVIAAAVRDMWNSCFSIYCCIDVNVIFIFTCLHIVADILTSERYIRLLLVGYV